MYLHRGNTRSKNVLLVDIYISLTRYVLVFCISLHCIDFSKSLDTSIQLRGLNLNHIYAIRVRAENAFGVSDPSQPVTSRLLTRGRFSQEMRDHSSTFGIIQTDDHRGDEEEPTSKPRRPPTSTYDEYGKHQNIFSMNF